MGLSGRTSSERYPIAVLRLDEHPGLRDFEINIRAKEVEKMNSRERMDTVLREKAVPDKVPHGDLMIWPEIIDALLGGETFPQEERVNYLFFWMSETMGDHFFERDRAAREMLAFDYTHVFPSENWKKIDSPRDGSDIY